MDNEKTKEIELVSEGDTKTFDKAGDDDSALYAFAGGEECLFELTRTPCAKGAELLRRHNWYTHKNTRFVVYAMFFAILLVFSVYYAVVGSYMIAAFAGAVGAFMLYIVLCGHRYFVTGMSFDENGNNDDGEVWFYGYSENPDDPNEEPVLDYIEDDDEYEKVAEAFDEYLDNCEFDELAD